jgi:hypothetical protein
MRWRVSSHSWMNAPAENLSMDISTCKWHISSSYFIHGHSPAALTQWRLSKRAPSALPNTSSSKGLTTWSDSSELMELAKLRRDPRGEPQQFSHVSWGALRQFSHFSICQMEETYIVNQGKHFSIIFIPNTTCLHPVTGLIQSCQLNPRILSVTTSPHLKGMTSCLLMPNGHQSTIWWSGYIVGPLAITGCHGLLPG